MVDPGIARRRRAIADRAAAAIGSSPRCDPAATLQQANRARVRRLDPPLHPVPWQAAPARDGSGRGYALPLGPRARPAGERVDAEPSARRVALSLRRGARGAAPVVERDRPRLAVTAS